ncbi:MAG: hypothetical protein ACE5H8_03850, partial [Alphaproteobacteria bacterium]
SETRRNAEQEAGKAMDDGVEIGIVGDVGHVRSPLNAAAGRAGASRPTPSISGASRAIQNPAEFLPKG